MDFDEPCASVAGSSDEIPRLDMATKNPYPLSPASGQPHHLARVSEKKFKANRENAKKSTGPRTSRGKAFSRRNAIKHGLFVTSATDFFLRWEDQEKYEELHNDLLEAYQPVGRAEELEVERMAQCWWRLMRANLYVVAIEQGVIRALVPEEEAQVRLIIHSKFPQVPHTANPSSANAPPRATGETLLEFALRVACACGFGSEKDSEVTPDSARSADVQMINENHNARSASNGNEQERAAA